VTVQAVNTKLAASSPTQTYAETDRTEAALSRGHTLGIRKRASTVPAPTTASTAARASPPAAPPRAVLTGLFTMSGTTTSWYMDLLTSWFA